MKRAWLMKTRFKGIDPVTGAPQFEDGTPDVYITYCIGGGGFSLAIPECREVVMITRKPIAPRSRVRNVVLDTGALT